MPEVNFIGTIQSVSANLKGCSLTWSVIPGNHGWLLKNGKAHGETHSAFHSHFLSFFPSSTFNSNGFFTISHPFDIHYSTSTSDGWPLFVCELWDRSFEDSRHFKGQGGAWIPTSPGKHLITVHLWTPIDSSAGLRETFLPDEPDLLKMRELIMNPYLRAGQECESLGVVHIEIYVAVCGFSKYNVYLED